MPGGRKGRAGEDGGAAQRERQGVKSADCCMRNGLIPSRPSRTERLSAASARDGFISHQPACVREPIGGGQALFWGPSHNLVCLMSGRLFISMGCPSHKRRKKKPPEPFSKIAPNANVSVPAHAPFNNHWHCCTFVCLFGKVRNFLRVSDTHKV